MTSYCNGNHSRISVSLSLCLKETENWNSSSKTLFYKDCSLGSERERQRETDRQRQTDRQSERDIQTDRQTDRHTETQRETDRHTHRQTEKKKKGDSSSPVSADRFFKCTGADV